MACPKCDGFVQRFNISTLREYQDVARQLTQIVSEGTFLLVRASCSLEAVFQTPMPGDIISHDFQCFDCGRKFYLGADTFHGRASWTVGDVPQPIGNVGPPN